MPMYGSRYIFSKSFFTGWVSVGIAWIFLSLLAVGVYPVWESRETLVKVTTMMLRGGRLPKRQVIDGEAVKAEETSGSATPVQVDTMAKK